MTDTYRDPDDLVADKETTSFHDDEQEIVNDETPVQRSPRPGQPRKTARRPPPRKHYSED